MTAQELIQLQIKQAGNQLNKVLEGLGESHKDFRSCPSAMTVGEQVAHLCECYQAVITESAGAKYEWGSYAPKSTEWSALIEEFNTIRSQAAAAVNSDEDTAIHRGTDFLVAHDNYHVGQLATARIALDSTWNPYSLYE